jgi:hypothetical protein
MTRRFCDICDKPLTPEDDLPFIRWHAEKDVQVMVAVTNSVGGILNDICQNCKEIIVIDGKPERPAAVQQKIATLQPNPASLPSPMRTNGGAGAPFVRSQPQPNGEGEPA